MDDEQILARGGTQDDINAIAHDNGACGAILGGTCDYCGKTDPDKLSQSNQVPEIDKQLRDILEDVHYQGEINGAEGVLLIVTADDIEKHIKLIKSLLSQSTKRAEIEGRIDEIENHVATITHGMTNDMFKHLQERLSELNQLKEVK